MNLHKMWPLMMFLLLVVGCSKASEPVGSSAHALSEGTIVNVAPNAPFLDTPSAVTPSANHFVVGATDHHHNFPAWVRSANNGVTWTECDITNNNNCNGMPVPPPPGLVGWATRPRGVMATDGAGNVAYIYLGFTPSGSPASPDLVGMITSTNSGATFNAAWVVNDNYNSGCPSALEDSPDATFDMTTQPPTLWVVWRHKGASSFGACFRSGQFFGGTFQWLGPVASVGGRVHIQTGHDQAAIFAV